MALGNNMTLSYIVDHDHIDSLQSLCQSNFLPFDLPLVGHMGKVGDLHVDTLVLTWTVMAVILGACMMARPFLVSNAPGGMVQGIMESLYDFTKGITKDQIPHDWKNFFPLIAAIFIFVLIANLSGILPWQWIASFVPGWPSPHEAGHDKFFEMAAPTTDFNVTFGLALVAFLTYLGSGFWKHKANYLKLYLNPIEWMDLAIRPATLSIRLMMVITADEILRGAALAMVPAIVPTGVMAFEMCIALIQAFVFALLTSIYIGLTVSHH